LTVIANRKGESQKNKVAGKNKQHVLPVGAPKKTATKNLMGRKKTGKQKKKSRKKETSRKVKSKSGKKAPAGKGKGKVKRSTRVEKKTIVSIITCKGL